MLAGSLLLTISAKIQVPFWPVPMTLQTGVVLALGAALGWRLAGAGVLTYLLQGAVGLPVFAGGAGFAYMTGPTGGYLLGFLVAALVVGRLAERGWDRSLLGSFAAMLLGNSLLFLCGVGYLAALIGVEQAISVGLLPFLAGEVLKIALVTALLPFVWTRLRRDAGT
ncbi:biotin transporter BioY [Algihabitans albus]|uniref:biotin transporter BioY n=1 Tax=Algihabitans albus TaxID=2164067 RepID=UPI001F28ABDF|nr:biotin transporter BioY [Algihabitans albus]